MAIAEASILRIPSRRRTQKPDLAGPVTATVIVHLLLMSAYVAAFHGDVSALVCVNQERIGSFPYECITAGFGKGGYDGQFYYVLARDPWHPAAAGMVDLPAYRHVRILYPALAWLLSGGGDPVLLLWVLPAINLAAIGVLAWLGATVATFCGRSPWWGFLLPVVLNVGLAALRDLTDPLSAAAVCGLLTAHLLGWRTIWLAAWATAAVLSREQNVVIVGVVLLGCLMQRRWSQVAALLFAVALLSVWVAVLYGFYGQLPISPDNLSTPFAGIWGRLRNPDGHFGSALLPIHALSMVFLTVQIVLSLVMLAFRAERTILLTALAGVALAVLAGPAVFEGAHSYARVLLWMPLGIFLWAMQSNRRLPIALLCPAALWQVFAVAQVWR
jgi:hypothetical protein